MSTAHPVESLTSEHRVIQSVLDAMQREVEDRLSAGELRVPFWERCMSFLRDFADRCHHGKEEELLFPMLERIGVPEGPVGVMRTEHEQGRAMVKWMATALDEGNVDALAGAASGFVQHLRQHIYKEDHVLFPMAQQALSTEQVAELQLGFAKAEREVLSGQDKQDYEIWAARLAAAGA